MREDFFFFFFVLFLIWKENFYFYFYFYFRIFMSEKKTVQMLWKSVAPVGQPEEGLVVSASGAVSCGARERHIERGRTQRESHNRHQLLSTGWEERLHFLLLLKNEFFRLPSSNERKKRNRWGNILLATKEKKRQEWRDCFAYGFIVFVVLCYILTLECVDHRILNPWRRVAILIQHWRCIHPTVEKRPAAVAH